MEDLEESDRSWLKQMEETKSKDKILYHMLELLYSTKSYCGSKESADNEFGLLLKLLPLELVDLHFNSNPLKGALQIFLE